MSEELQNIAKKITPILIANNVASAGVFGSYARGEATAESDVDILVELRRPFGFFKFIGLQNELEQALNKKVDLATANSLNKFIKPQAMRDLKIIYG